MKTNNDNVESLALIDQEFYRVEKNSGFFSFTELYNVIVALIHGLIFRIEQAEKKGLNREDIRAELLNTWRIHGQSSFVRHIQSWPRGYPGDFQVIDMIMDRKEKSLPDTLGGIIGHYALNSAIAQQHREKVKIQTEMVKETCRKFGNISPLIISLACGSSRDLEEAQHEIKEAKARILLVDFDNDALKESRKRLHLIEDQIDTAQVNVRRLPKLLETMNQENGKFHLIYMGGLFDYLPSGIIKIILEHIGRYISDDGLVMFTNIKVGNPYRPWIETMGNWNLIERKEEEMKEFFTSLNLKNTSLKTDPTGLTWIAKASNEIMRM